MKTDKTIPGILFGISLILCATVTAQAGEDQPDAYIMTVYSDVAHGTDIIDGAPQEVISKLSRKFDARSNELAGQVNLCVAYTKMKQLEKAMEVCDSAIAAALKDARQMERSNIFGRQTTIVADTGRAIALTNRGVLHAVTGEKAKARLMFEMALMLKSKEESARANLRFLEREAATKDS
jgi:hypothetical protein